MIYRSYERTRQRSGEASRTVEAHSRRLHSASAQEPSAELVQPSSSPDVASLASLDRDRGFWEHRDTQRQRDQQCAIRAVPGQQESRRSARRRLGPVSRHRRRFRPGGCQRRAVVGDQLATVLAGTGGERPRLGDGRGHRAQLAILPAGQVQEHHDDRPGARDDRDCAVHVSASVLSVCGAMDADGA